MGCYPIFTCQDWSKLAPDLQDLGDALVSLALVTDPFGEYDEPYLRRNFDIVFPFKEHYVVDLQRPITEFCLPAPSLLRPKGLGECSHRNL